LPSVSAAPATTVSAALPVSGEGHRRPGLEVVRAVEVTSVSDNHRRRRLVDGVEGGVLVEKGAIMALPAASMMPGGGLEVEPQCAIADETATVTV